MHTHERENKEESLMKRLVQSKQTRLEKQPQLATHNVYKKTKETDVKFFPTSQTQIVSPHYYYYYCSKNYQIWYEGIVIFPLKPSSDEAMPLHQQTLLCHPIVSLVTIAGLEITYKCWEHICLL